MKRIVSLVSVVAVVLATAVPAFAEQPVTLTGWVTDEYCGKINANAAGADCARACVKKGAKLVLFADEKIYKLADQDEAKKHVGHEVVVSGLLAEDGTLTAAKFKAKPDEAKLKAKKA